MTIKLSADQDAAVDKFLNFIHDPHEREMVLEGYPGCGKSFVTDYFIKALAQNNQIITMLDGTADEVEAYFSATTNKAAVVLGNFLNQPTSTIHSALGLVVKNNYETGSTKLVHANPNKINYIKRALIIIDEASYIDDYLLEMIRSQTSNCKILYIGDRYQLANVNCNRPPVFYNINNKATLTSSKRFNENGAIAALGQQLRDTIDTGVWQPINANGVDIIECTSADFQQRIDNEFTSIGHLSSEARILAWTNKRVEQYNKYIRNKFVNSPTFQPSEEVIVAKTMNIVSSQSYYMQNIPVETELVVKAISPTCPVMNQFNFRQQFDIDGTRAFGVGGEEFEIEGYYVKFFDIHPWYFVPNSYDDYHSLIKKLTKQAKAKRNWREYFYAKENIIDVRSAFATTVYKAQGSTYKRVFIDLPDIGKCHQWEQVARMLHVAVTRASEQVILRGRLPEKYGG